MAVETTSGLQTVMYDTVTGFAFGPVFDDGSDASDFLDWLQKGENEDRKFQHGHDELLFKADPRVYRPDEIQHLHTMWQDERD